MSVSQFFWLMFGILGMVLGISIVAIFHFYSKKQETQLKKVKKELYNMGFRSSIKYETKGALVAINEPTEKCIFIDKSHPLEYRIVDFEKIVSVEILQDGNSVIKTNLGSALV